MSEDKLSYPRGSNTSDLYATVSSMVISTAMNVNTTNYDNHLRFNEIIPDSVLVSTFFVILALTLVLNIYVLIIVTTSRCISNVTTIFIFSLSVADLLTGCTVSTFALVQTMFPRKTSVYACELPVYVELTCVAATILSHLAVGVDRYVAVIYPRLRRTDTRMALCVVSGLWVVSFLYSLRLIPQFGQRRLRNMNFCNLFMEEKEDDLLFRSLDFTFLYIVPVTALAYMYGRAGKRLWRKQGTIPGSLQRKRRVVIFLAVSSVVFGLCWCPFYILDITGDILKKGLPHEEVWQVEENEAYVSLRFTFVCMALSSSFLTPLAYIVFFSSMRAATQQAVSNAFGSFSTNSTVFIRNPALLGRLAGRLGLWEQANSAMRTKPISRRPMTSSVDTTLFQTQSSDADYGIRALRMPNKRLGNRRGKKRVGVFFHPDETAESFMSVQTNATDYQEFVKQKIIGKLGIEEHSSETIQTPETYSSEEDVPKAPESARTEFSAWHP